MWLPSFFLGDSGNDIHTLYMKILPDDQRDFPSKSWLYFTSEKVWKLLKNQYNRAFEPHIQKSLGYRKAKCKKHSIFMITTHLTKSKCQSINGQISPTHLQKSRNWHPQSEFLSNCVRVIIVQTHLCLYKIILFPTLKGLLLPTISTIIAALNVKKSHLN